MVDDERLDRSLHGPRALTSVPDAPWLPSGGRADVIVVGEEATLPDPTCLVRLLVTRRGSLLTVPRADGDGVDIPTSRVADGDVAAVLRRLVVQTLGEEVPAHLLGYVRNEVLDPPDSYPWPSPRAHFCVWHCEAPAGAEPRGTWLDRATAPLLLSARHWWPLVGHLPT